MMFKLVFYDKRVFLKTTVVIWISVRIVFGKIHRKTLNKGLKIEILILKERVTVFMVALSF